ncbi:MAG: HlyD family efflux transporter periplasmic adaptor subunit [Christensenellales bacterium]
MTGKKRVTGRFYLFVGIVLVGLYFMLRDYFPAASNEALVRNASATFSTKLDCVIIRDEKIGTSAVGGRIVYLANEGQPVSQGDPICEVYTASYADKELSRLEATRQSIREYHMQILDNIVDTELERLEGAVQTNALQLKKLVNRLIPGSLVAMVDQLQISMEERQNYLSQNRREDTKLNQLYEEETKRESALQAWRALKTAESDGIVSFYMDGLEEVLTPESYKNLTSTDMHTILSGGIPDLGTTLTTTSRTDAVYRIVGDEWYIALLGDSSWSPINDQFFTFQFEGYEDLAYSGTVVQVQKTGNDVIAILKVNGPVLSLINRRYGKAGISTYLSGLSIPIAALDTQNDQTGVWVNDVPGGTFVPVIVLSMDNQNALVVPVATGTLEVGQTVLIK